jgi:hypothetical protein
MFVFKGEHFFVYFGGHREQGGEGRNRYAHVRDYLRAAKDKSRRGHPVARRLEFHATGFSPPQLRGELTLLESDARM